MESRLPYDSVVVETLEKIFLVFQHRHHHRNLPIKNCGLKEWPAKLPSMIWDFLMIVSLFEKLLTATSPSRIAISNSSQHFRSVCKRTFLSSLHQVFKLRHDHCNLHIEDCGLKEQPAKLHGLKTDVLMIVSLLKHYINISKCFNIDMIIATFPLKTVGPNKAL